MKRYLLFFFIILLLSCENKNLKILTNKVDFFDTSIFITLKNNVYLIKNDKIYKKQLFITDYFTYNDKLFLCQDKKIFEPEIKNEIFTLKEAYNASHIYIYKDRLFLLKDKKLIFNKDGNIKKVRLDKIYESFKVIEETIILKHDNKLYLKRIVNNKIKDIKTLEYVFFFQCFDYNIFYLDVGNNIKKYDITTTNEILIDTVPFFVSDFKIFDNILIIYGKDTLGLFYVDSGKIEIGKIDLLDATISIKENKIVILKDTKISFLDLTDKKIVKEIDLIFEM